LTRGPPTTAGADDETLAANQEWIAEAIEDEFLEEIAYGEEFSC
jgi:hypothetical protein